MLRSPGTGPAQYLRLTPHEIALADRMDGTRSVVALWAISPGSAARSPRIRCGGWWPTWPLPVRIGHGLLAAARGRRLVLANPDRAVGALYRWGGRLLFTRAAAIGLALLVVAGLAAFVLAWVGGAESVFLAGDSYLTGALVLLGLNVVALACHELGHALATKHAGRRVPATGVLLYFGIPSVFVDTTSENPNQAN